MRGIKTLKDVVDWGLCTGCGACFSSCKSKGVTLVNVEGVGIRPRFHAACGSCSDCLPVCPGYQVDAGLTAGQPTNPTEAEHEFGRALEIWEGYAADAAIRHSASSGGALSALALYCLEQEDMNFVLHTAKDEAKPWTNQTVRSRNREDLLARTGSRYAPASPVEGLASIEESDRPCVFIGKPCDTASVSKMRQTRPALDKNLGLVLAFFCAGTPSTKGTLDLVESLGVKVAEVQDLHYRGKGWPGRFTVLPKNAEAVSLSYAESWGALTHHRPGRCHLCPDGLGRVADIACGDAWDKFEENGDPGRSLIIVRTPRGQEILRKAMEKGYLVGRRTDAAQVMKAQSNLLTRRREIFGRLLGMRLLGMPTPRLEGFSLFHSWRQLPLATKARTVVGTMVRLLQKGTWRARPVF